MNQNNHWNNLTTKVNFFFFGFRIKAFHFEEFAEKCVLNRIVQCDDIGDLFLDEKKCFENSEVQRVYIFLFSD